MTENDKLALQILMELKSAKPETRDAWKSKALDAFPQDAEFIKVVYDLANE